MKNENRYLLMLGCCLLFFFKDTNQAHKAIFKEYLKKKLKHEVLINSNLRIRHLR